MYSASAADVGTYCCYCNYNVAISFSEQLHFENIESQLQYCQEAELQLKTSICNIVLHDSFVDIYVAINFNLCSMLILPLWLLYKYLCNS